MKVAFIFGKGIEGCGVTRGATILEKWLTEHGHQTVNIDFDCGQIFYRARNLSFTGPILKCEKNWTVDDCKDILAEVNSCDIAILHSVPTRKQEKYIDRCREFMSRVHDPIIVVHDHGITKSNINMIPQGGEIMSMADVGVVQSLNGHSKQMYTAIDKSMESNLYENPIWVDTQLYDKFRASAEERRKHIVYMGRMSSIKDPAMICRLLPHVDIDEWDLSLIGCERSISGATVTEPLDLCTAPYIPAYRNLIRIHSVNVKGEIRVPRAEALKTNTKINSYEKYAYDWGMETLGKSMGSWCGYRLRNSEEYGNRMEYTMIESYLLSMPIIQRHFAENAKSPEGKLWGEYDGPIIAEAREEAFIADEMKRIAASPNEFNERTRACQELINKFNNIDVLAPKFLDFVLTKGKRSDKINYIEAISDFFPDAAARRANGEIIVSSGTSILNKKPMTLVAGKNNEIKPVKDVASLEGFF
tara:strand:+ start:8022 stop:9440 length:1419 start_codon:yes stop_codon:yes gene_type:complete